MVSPLVLCNLLIICSLAPLVDGGSDFSVRGGTKHAKSTYSAQSVNLQSSLVRHLPTLIDATVEDLADGLGRSCFTSVALVKVRRTFPPFLFLYDILRTGQSLT